MQPLVVKYGVENVFLAGIARLGYPAILCTESYEIEAVRKELERE